MAGRFNIKNYKRIRSFIRRNGVIKSYYKVLERLARDNDEKNYSQSVKESAITTEQADKQRNTEFDKSCRISILVPVYRPDEQVFIKMLESVAAQTYTNWELCIADAGGEADCQRLVQDFIHKHESDANGVHTNKAFTDKVVYNHLDTNGGISANLNAALEMATGEYVTFLDHDDVITEDALFEIISILNNRSAFTKGKKKSHVKFIYSDEDKVSYDDSVYFDHHRKVDFDRAMLLTNNYICHLLVVDTELTRSVGGFNPEYDGSQDFDFAIKCSEKLHDDEIVHVPRVLYHWRSSRSSTAENPDAKLYAYEAGKKAVHDYLHRCGIDAKVYNTPHLGYFEVDFPEDAKTVLKMTPEVFGAMNEEAFNKINEDYIMVVSDELRPMVKDCEKLLKGPLMMEYAGATTGKIIAHNKIESAGYIVSDNGGIEASCEGLNMHFSGYMHRASTLRCVDAFDNGCVLYKRNALEWKLDGPHLKDGFRCIYVPKAMYRRK